MRPRMFTYPVILTPEDGGFVVTFPDLPGAVSEGDDEAEALARAVDALETMFMAIMADREAIPRPSAVRRRGRSVTLPAMSAAKIALYEAMRKSKVGKSELARRLDLHLPQVDRLLDLRHASRLEQIDRALGAVGKRLVVEVRDAA